MKILMVNPFYYPYHGGTEKHIRQISKILVKKGHEVTVLCGQQPNTKLEETFEGINIVRVPAKILNWLPHPLPPPYPLMLNFEGKYRELVKKGNFDIVHFHNRFVFGPGVISIAEEQNSKTILTIHNARTKDIDRITDFLGQSYDNNIGWNVMRNCDGIIGVSKWALETTIPKDYKGRTTVIHNGFDPKQYDPDKTDKKYWKEFFEKKGFDGKLLLTNVRLIKQKGLEYLIKGMKGVEGGYLVILGRGPLEKELKEIARKENVPVYFLTKIISEERLKDLYSSAYLFLLSSLYEPCAVALTEAQSMGLPIIATQAGGNLEIVKEGRTGLSVPPRNSKEFTKKINYLMKNENTVKELSKNAKKRSTQFTWDVAAKKTEKFYKKILS